MPKVWKNSIRNYRKALHKCTHIFECETCKQQFSAWNYTLHMYCDHDLAKSTTCPWYKCSIQSMTADADHLRSCFERFLIRSLLKAQNMSLDQPTNSPRHSKCSCINFDSKAQSRQMSGRPRLQVSPYFYESFCEDFNSDWFNPAIRTSTDHMAAIENNQLMFSSESGLGSDAPMFIRKFIELEATTKWYHVIIRASVFDTFYEGVQAEQNLLGLLPFWCLCDGVSDSIGREPKYIHHRHMILVSSKDAFKRIWNRVKPVERNFSREPCKASVPITSVFHLVNVIRYVGTPYSNCQGMGQLETNKANNGMHHYYITRPICEHGDRNLCQLWPGGLQSYFQSKYGKFHVDKWCDVAKKEGNQWTIPLAVLNQSMSKCVVPYNHDFEPAYIIPLSHFDTKTAEGYLFLPNDHVMVLKRNSNLPKGSEWFEYQINHGNCMNDAIKNYRYILTRSQHSAMKQVMTAREPLERQIDDLKIQLEGMHNKLDTQTRQWELTQGSVQQTLREKEALNLKIKELHEQIRQTAHERTVAAEPTFETQAQLLETIRQKDCKIEELKQSVMEKVGEIEKLQLKLAHVELTYGNLKIF